MVKWVPNRGKSGLIRGVSTEAGEIVVRWHGLGSPSSKKGQERANLICSAPDLLKTLEMVRSHLVRLAWEENSLMIEGIDKAISKAKGETNDHN